MLYLDFVIHLCVTMAKLFGLLQPGTERSQKNIYFYVDQYCTQIYLMKKNNTFSGLHRRL